MLGPRSPPRPSNPWQDAQTDSNAFRPSSAEEWPAWVLLAGGFVFCSPVCNTSAQAEKNAEAMAAQRMRREESNIKSALRQVAVRERISVICIVAAKSDFSRAPYEHWGVKSIICVAKNPAHNESGR